MMIHLAAVAPMGQGWLWVSSSRRLRWHCPHSFCTHLKRRASTSPSSDLPVRSLPARRPQARGEEYSEAIAFVRLLNALWRGLEGALPNEGWVGAGREGRPWEEPQTNSPSQAAAKAAST